MKGKGSLLLIFILGVIAVALLLLPLSPQARTPQACTEFRAIGQATYPTPHQLNPDDSWGGDFYGSLGGEVLIGIFSGNDGNVLQHGVTGMGTNGRYIFVFDSGGSFIMDVGHAAWPFPPGKVGMGEYRGTAKINGGTGRFKNAWGNLNWQGPFIFYTLNGVDYIGKYNAEIRGAVCGVQ